MHFINQALSALGPEYKLNEAKKHLRAAWNALEDVSAKRAKKQEAKELFKEKAKTRHQEWLKGIQENAQKFAAMQQDQQNSS